MPKKKAINWPAIKKRYLQGEKPKDIGADYGLTAKQVSDKAHRDDWTRKKTEIVENVSIHVEDDLKALCTETIAVHLEFIRKLRAKRPDGTTMMDDIQNPYLFDGERTNSLFQTAMNNSVKVILAAMKAHDDSGVDDEPAGFHISQDA